MDKLYELSVKEMSFDPRSPYLLRHITSTVTKFVHSLQVYNQNVESTPYCNPFYEPERFGKKEDILHL